MCPHCLSSAQACPHCGGDRPLRPPTERSIQNFKTARIERGITKSSLTNDDRDRLGIFRKPWRGVASPVPIIGQPRRVAIYARFGKRPAVILNNAFANLHL